MSKRNKAERKKKKRQERIRQEKHQRQVTPAAPSLWDDDLPDWEDDVRAMDIERWLRGHALRTGQWVVGLTELAQALQASKSLDPVVGPGEVPDASDAEQAQEIAFLSMEARDDDKVAFLARAALEIDATNVDARNLLIIHETADDPEETRRRLLELLDEAGKTLDQTLFSAPEGKLSRLLSARPFLRVLQGLIINATQTHDLERLAPLIQRCAHFDQTAAWVMIGRVLTLVDEDEQWEWAARLRDVVTDRDVGRLALDSLLALHQGNRRAAVDLIRQACVLNPSLHEQLCSGSQGPNSELGYEATTILTGLQRLIDDLEDFYECLPDDLP